MVLEFDPDDLYLTGIRLVDEQHAQFAGLILRIHRDLTVDANSPDSIGLLNELVAYAAYHFQSEENLMRRAGYPGFDAHKDQHLAITRELKQHVEEVMAGRSSKAKLTMFTWKWLVNHTNLADNEMAAYLSSIGG